MPEEQNFGVMIMSDDAGRLRKSRNRQAQRERREQQCAVDGRPWHSDILTMRRPGSSRSTACDRPPEHLPVVAEAVQ